MYKTYNRAMIELVYEIRRKIESEHKPSIKLANPDLLITLVVYYQECENAILKALIKELMCYAGERWEQQLANVLDTSMIQNHEVNVYRGSTSIKDKPFNHAETQKNISNTKSGLIYRGQVVK